jgi:hypothetical protein
VNALTNKLDELVRTNVAVAERIDQMWYAPGMPGALQAQKHFVDVTSSRGGGEKKDVIRQ